MATNMTPHNLSEVVDAIVKVVDDESISIESVQDNSGSDFLLEDYLWQKRNTGSIQNR